MPEKNFSLAKFNHSKIDKKWQKYWINNDSFKTNFITKKPKYYVLDMFPYPSGSGLHVGHPKGYTATDVIARYKRLQGFEVLHPIGWDAFGLPAEQYALKTGKNPYTFTNKNINNFRHQLQSIGFSYDYSLEVNTTDPKYYKWTQWIFLQLYKHGLAKIRYINVNYCPKLGTVLANEEIICVNGKMVSERGEFPVIKKKMQQWVLKITEFAEELLDFSELNWPKNIIEIQKNWIGKSTGYEINFLVQDDENKKTTPLKIFSTKVETLPYVKFIAICPEYPLLEKFIIPSQKNKVKTYLDTVKKKNDLEREINIKTSAGCFTGSFAVNPLDNQKIPIYIADYVLEGYGTGAIMGVPNYDERDNNFYNFHKIGNITGQKHTDILFDNKKIFTQKEKLVIINDSKLKNNLSSKVNYRLKDWIFSRQRYWGEPFPVLFDEKQNIILLDESELPLKLPIVDKVEIGINGKGPLSKLKNWTEIKKGKEVFSHDTNTMPQWAGSCWYYLGYILKEGDDFLPLNSEAAKTRIKSWLPVDFYVGGQEHAVLHLMYARFWHKFLYKIGIVNNKEPFKKLFNQGIILGPNGEKMSKSKGNVINPNDLIDQYGADAFRVYEMFMGPLDATLPWDNNGIKAMRKWLDRIYAFAYTFQEVSNDELETIINPLIKDITLNIEDLKFNVAISKLMILSNVFIKHKQVKMEHFLAFLITLNVFAPHISSEIALDKFNIKLENSKWPIPDPKYLIKKEIQMVIQIFGKTKGIIPVPINSSKDQVIEIIKNNAKFSCKLNNIKIVKEIFVPNKIINFIGQK